LPARARPYPTSSACRLPKPSSVTAAWPRCRSTSKSGWTGVGTGDEDRANLRGFSYQLLPLVVV
jgi:hypothetical protein